MTHRLAVTSALLIGALMAAGCSKEVASVTCPDFDHMRRAAALNAHIDVWVTGGGGDITQARIDRQRALIAKVTAWANKQQDQCVKAAYLAEADMWGSAANDAQEDLNRLPERAASDASERKTRDEDWEAVKRARAAIPSPPGIGDSQ